MALIKIYQDAVLSPSNAHGSSHRSGMDSHQVGTFWIQDERHIFAIFDIVVGCLRSSGLEVVHGKYVHLRTMTR